MSECTKVSQTNTNPGYWKIGVGLADVSAVCSWLAKQGVEVGVPSQFLDVGYLTHLADPAGNTIELLQDSLEQNFVPLSSPSSLFDNARVGQLTLRVRELERSLRFYQDVLGMVLLCHYDVSPYNFSLYFLAFTNDRPPSDPTSLAAREWTYQRPYTTLELQVRHTAPAVPYTTCAEDEVGWHGFVCSVTSLDAITSHLHAHGVETHAVSPAAVAARDPDGYPVRFVACAS